MENSVNALLDVKNENTSLQNTTTEEQPEEVNLETFTLLWCDTDANSTDDHRQTQRDLRHSINFLKIFEFFLFFSLEFKKF